MINKKRKFINAYEETTVRPGMAITLEPRAILKNHPDMPTIYFHNVILFKDDGKKELLTNFDGIFKLADMDYVL